ncbi:hypothetical protein KAFR_0B01830 [Kazachstania africana CBS 2517]|uniref:Nuclear pore protein n=1 Tax=Kazachstania africana (strain ATCC 22294 / BCRC 22015 / CBS 2517 / CECT 1963 / NBRC 1671 / NRRL Y-8276) TaxID=1071382 RepID=H2AQ32_KAZAF|nr:hypothetical protein KAFR_0B01830 [Kazachstania africana CBS 2517]CCF56482.1 hypothetical protein KAFR_0B01830 [Kazachstania africana CBS 2517]
MDGDLKQQNASSLKSTSKLFNDLIESSKTLPTTSSELGSIQLSINEINRRSKDLRSSYTHGKPESVRDHTKAHYLLAGSGLAFEDVDSSLNFLKDNKLNKTITTTTTAAQQQRQVNTDGMEIDSYLKIKKDENILASIEQLLSYAAKDFDNFINQNLNLDWNQRKDLVKENFGVLIHKNESNSSKATSKIMNWGLDKNKNKNFKILNNNSNESKLNVNENYLVREIFETYAKTIHAFNNSRQMGQMFPLTKEFISLLSSNTAHINNVNDSKKRQLLESWKVLDNLGGIADHKDTVSNAKDYLEKQFLGYVDSLYNKNMDEGLPTNINKIKSFIESKLKNTSSNTWKISNLTIVNGEPIWALIFYLLRAGLKKEALEIAINNKSSFKKVEQSFLAYFKAYISSNDNRLPIEFSNKLHTEYNQHIKNSLNGDPYRLAVYKIIGRCDLTRKNISSVTLSIEDWLWVHFMLIKDDINDNDPIYERYTLEDFQNIILSYGEARFTNNYLQVLVLSGLYELAVEYAYSFNEFDAVHLAIGFANENLLKIASIESILSDTNSSSKLVVFNKKTNQREINFAKLIGNYVRSFKFSDPRIATEYLILINLNNNGNAEQIELCHESLRELILETNEFTILLGKINRDGSRIPGVIEERQSLLQLRDTKEFLRTITEQAARKADEDGRSSDSLLLYQLSEDYDIVITIVNGLLSDILSNTDLNQNLISFNDNSETNPILLAEKLITIYMENLEISKKVHTKNKETCILLLSLIEVRKLFIAKQWQNTLSAIEQIDLLPFTDELSARKKAQDFTTLNENIIKCIPNLLIITMTCLSNLITSLNQSEYQLMSKIEQIDALKKVAKNCMVYAGMIQYKMPRETYSTLINLDVGL